MPPATEYVAFKALHVVGVIVFLGNITSGLFWKALADSTKDRKVIAHTLQVIIRLDRLLTIPGVVAVIVGGVGAATVAHLAILGTGWILWSIILFIISGIAFGPVSRSQRQMLAVAQAAQTSGVMNWEDYNRFARTWNIAGTIALVAPLIAVLFMVTKPSLPAF